MGGLAAAAGLLGFLRRPRLTVLALALLAIALGLARAHTHAAARPAPLAVLPERAEVRVIGRVVQIPDPDRRRPLLLEAEEAALLSPDGTPDAGAAVAGRVHVFSFSPAHYAGQRVQVSGALRRYAGSPPAASRSPMGRIDRPRVEPLPGGAPIISGGLAALRARLQASIRRALPEPHSALLAAILLGIRSEIPGGLREALNAAGLTHLIAISGANVTLLAVVVRRLAGFVLGRRAVLLVMALLPFYALMVGADPPVVRATVMAELVLIAWVIGRESHLPTTLVLAAAAMALADPDVLGQVSFQLSFVATFGLVALAPRIAAALQFLPRPLAEGAAVTVSAQILTMPLLAAHFGRLSVLSVPANIMALPFSPWVMFTGLFATLWSFAGIPGAHLAAWPAWAPLEYLIWLAKFWGSFSSPASTVPKAPSWVVALSYLLLAGTIWWAGRSRMPGGAADRRRISPWAAGALGALALLAPPAAGAAGGLFAGADALAMVAVLEGSRATLYGRTAGGVNFIIAGSAHGEAQIDRLFPFYDPATDLLVLRDLQPPSTAMAAQAAQRAPIGRIWARNLDLPPAADSLLIPVDVHTFIEVLTDPAGSPDPALRIVSGGFSVLVPGLGPPPLQPPSNWKSTLLLLPERYHSGYTDPAFLRAAGIEAVITGAGPSGAATIVRAAAIRSGAAPAPLGPASTSGPALALTWNGEVYRAYFPE